MDHFFRKCLDEQWLLVTWLARGETEWVFVDIKSGRSRVIPDEVKNAFPVVAKEQEPR